ncbi:MAG TPA: hypothetical protein VGF61_04270, partial [Candidatus Acidoferrum sp.]|jgi:hypothetical protein
MPAHPKYNGLCLNHGTIHKRTSVREDDLYMELASPTGDFHSAADVNNALGKLFHALAANRVSTKRAATLAYIGYLLMQSQGNVEAEVRMVALQGCKDLRQMLEMAYGKAGKKEEKGN